MYYIDSIMNTLKFLKSNITFGCGVWNCVNKDYEVMYRNWLHIFTVILIGVCISLYSTIL